MMDNNPEMASWWKGRILMSVGCVKTDKPELKICAIGQELKDQAAEWLKPTKFQIFAEVSQGICLPGNAKYKVKIRIGDFECTTGGPVDKSHEYCFWNHRFNETTYEAPYRNHKCVSKFFNW
jgi:hypothetical protein